ncbi:MAG: PQQ-binding-like beta-propeller repeat protein, partial [Armatimonadota bacterium]
MKPQWNLWTVVAAVVLCVLVQSLVAPANAPGDEDAQIDAGGQDNGGSDADWPMWRYDAGRSGASPAELPENLQVQWTRDLPPPRPAFPPAVRPRLCFDKTYRPVAADGLLFVPSMVTDSVTAYDLDTGAERWRFYADGPVRLAPAVHRGSVYFVSDDGYLYCLDAGTGQMLWRYTPLPVSRREQRLLGDGRMISRWPARGGPV